MVDFQDAMSTKDYNAVAAVQVFFEKLEVGEHVYIAMSGLCMGLIIADKDQELAERLRLAMMAMYSAAGPTENVRKLDDSVLKTMRHILETMDEGLA